MYIHPEHHRKGLGSVLVKEILCIAREMKFRSIIGGCYPFFELVLGAKEKEWRN